MDAKQLGRLGDCVRPLICELSPAMSGLRREATTALRAALLRDPNIRLPDDCLDELARSVSRESLQSIMKPIQFQRAVFMERGRSPRTQKARGLLFDFALGAEAARDIRSFADIARHCECTRAAISAMDKQLPPTLPKRSGRKRA